MDIADRIKEKLPLVEYVKRRVKLERNGQTWTGVCPFHGDSNPSFVVWEKDDHWHCFGCGKGGDIFTFHQTENNCDFKESLKELAHQVGIELRYKPEELVAQSKARRRAQILDATLEYYRTQLKPEHIGYLHSRGFTDEFITSYRFGFAPGGGLRKHLANYPLDELKALGLVNHDGRDFFWNRLIIPVYGRDADIVNLVGRIWNGDESTRKYLRLPGDSQLVNERGLRNTDVVYLCEGDTDTPTLVQLGLPAVGVPGASALKDEYADKFKRIKTVYVCADADEAGNKLAIRAGELLGNRCQIVELPANEDINSWIGVKGHDISDLTAKAKPFVDYLVSKLPTEIEANTIDQVLAPILHALLQVGKASQDVYIKQISKRIGMSAAAIKEALRELVQTTAEAKKAIADSDGRIIWRDVSVINPAQDFVNGAMYTVAFLDVMTTDTDTQQRKIETMPYAVTSKREIFPLTDTEAYQRGLRITPTKVPMFSIVGRRWSIADDLPYSVKSYLDAGATVSPWEVYLEVASYFRNFIDYPNDLYYDFMALWTIGTYFYNLYQAFPYVHLTGTKRVGKSLSLKVVAELAFNALHSSSMSSAAAYRAVEACSTSLLLDEAENLQKKDKNENQDDKIEILKAGYMKGPKAIRCTGDAHEPVGFDVYSPKMFGSIQSMDRILADRAITLTLARKKRQLPEFDFVEQRGEMARTRDKLYVLMLDHAKDIVEEIHAGINWDGVKDRERELWTPILTMAQFFDGYQIAEAGNNIQSEHLLTTRMRLLAFQKGEEKLAKEQAEQTELLILEGVIDFLKSANPVQGQFYPSNAIFEHLKKSDDLGWLNSSKYVINELERLTVIQNKKVDTVRVRIDGKQTRAIRLDPNRISEIAKRYGVAVPDVTHVTAKIGGVEG